MDALKPLASLLGIDDPQVLQYLPKKLGAAFQLNRL